MTNRLSNEKSPYLLQHANNPVNWFPWSPDAFEAAKRENKLIFLSIGYSTCHWCHVMERESFENKAVADIMNQYYINVKVDREERPDVDKVYMSFVQATLGRGGWPLSVFLTPELKPVFGGTYFPPDDHPFIQQPGFKTVLKSISSQWIEDPERVLKSGNDVYEILKERQSASSDDVTLVLPEWKSAASKCFQMLRRSYDHEYGGFSKRPKFPEPVNFNFLFKIVSDSTLEREVREQSLQMIRKTLDTMAKGGIWDHVSKGFARYSTDSQWHVPHFEKMLYDQAQLLVSYSQCFAVTGVSFYRKIAEDIILYTLRDLRHPSGGFYSAEDADSYPTVDSDSKKEGAFCVWTYTELETLFKDDPDTFEAVIQHYGVKKSGNVTEDPHGELRNQNVLTNVGNDSADESVIERANRKMFEARLKRPRPHLDDKILTSWNGLMISGLAIASASFGEKRYADESAKTANFVLNHLYDSEARILYRSVYKKNEDSVESGIPIPGFLDDYAYLIRGLLDLYDVDHDFRWIKVARDLQRIQDETFWDDDKDGGYFSSRADDPTILLRVKEAQDGAEPSGNSVSAHNLIRLAALLDEPELVRDKAKRLFQTFAEKLNKYPVWMPEMVTALRSFQDPPIRIVITGRDSNQNPLLDAVNRTFISNTKVLIVITPETSHDNVDLVKIPTEIRDQAHLNRAYVCKEYSCSAPVDTVEDLVQILKIDLPAIKS